MPFIKQLNLLSNDPKPSYKLQDYLLSQCNIQTYQQLIIEKWKHHCTILYGKAATGKTHLSHIWQENNQAIFLESLNELHLLKKNYYYIVENIHKIVNETELLHVYNLTKEHNCKLLLTTDVLPKFLPYKLADLKSRILSTRLLKLPQDNEYLFKAMLLKEFSIRQIKISKEVIEYIVTHTERSIPKLIEVVRIMDKASMQEKRNITIPFIKSVLE